MLHFYVTQMRFEIWKQKQKQHQGAEDSKSKRIVKA
uniref:Uncharacterized protein n=1 Tax=Rhizophora mucronata TaxID=61149 RepID=A0A2P2IYG2_RHIMU